MAAAGRVVIDTEKAPRPLGPFYRQAIQYGGMLYLSGQAGIVPKTGELISDDVAAQTKQALTDIVNVLEAGGSSADNVVKVNVFLTDLNDYAAVNKVYADVFSSNPPARSAVQVAALPKNSRVCFDAIAVALNPPSNA